MAFPRGTTPTLTFELDDNELDLSTANNVYVTIKNGLNVTTKTGQDLTIDENQVSVKLTQAETLAFTNKKIRIQINWTYNDGSRWSSEIVEMLVSEQLLDRVVE